jgi:hypothetical protein
MKQHEREYFTSRIRSGIININLDVINLRIQPITLEEELKIQESYLLAYRKAKQDGFLENDEILENLRTRGVWTAKDDEKEKGLEQDIESLKVQLFQNKNKSDWVQQIKRYLTAGRQQLNEVLEKKHQFFENSCEGIAQVEKAKKLIELSCYKLEPDGNLMRYDFSEIPIDHIIKLYGYQLLSEGSIREIARSEPWRSTWVLRDSNAYELFANKGKQLTQDQKSLLVWSRMYDNVQESLDAPSDDVIEDDDMLDGWFIIQRKKRDQEKAKSDIEKATSNSKIANSSEIFVMAHSKKDADRINNSNTFHAQKIKEQRIKLLQNKGAAEDLDFQDQQLKTRQQSNEMYKGKFRR